MADKWPLVFLNSQARRCALVTETGAGIPISRAGSDLDLPREFEASVWFFSVCKDAVTLWVPRLLFLESALESRVAPYVLSMYARNMPWMKGDAFFVVFFFLST